MLTKSKPNLIPKFTNSKLCPKLIWHFSHNYIFIIPRNHKSLPSPNFVTTFLTVHSVSSLHHQNASLSPPTTKQTRHHHITPLAGSNGEGKSLLFPLKSGQTGENKIPDFFSLSSSFFPPLRELKSGKIRKSFTTSNATHFTSALGTLSGFQEPFAPILKKTFPQNGESEEEEERILIFW